MTMANRISKSFNHRQLALQQQLMGDGGGSELVEPSQYRLQGRRIAEGSNLADLMVSQGQCNKLIFSSNQSGNQSGNQR